MSWKVAWLCLLTAVAAVGCRRGEQASTPERAPVVFVTADLRGYLAPCGCTENMRGGIARAAAQVLSARREGPTTLIDAGDSLYSAPALSPALLAQEERKAKTLAQALLHMGLAAKAVGELDEAAGPDARSGLSLPELSPGTVKVLPVGAAKVAVVAGKDAPQLVAAAASVRREGPTLVLGLLHQNLVEAQRAAEQLEGRVDLLIAAHAGGEAAAEENRLVRGAVPVAQLQSKGRSLLRLELAPQGANAAFALQRTPDDVAAELEALDQRVALLKREIALPGVPEATKALRQKKLEEVLTRRSSAASTPLPAAAGNAFSARFVPLEPTLPTDPQVEAMVRSYDQDVAKLNLAWAQQHGTDCPPAAKGKPAFVGNAACRECHEEAFPVWDASKHAHAYETLVEGGKQFHLDCVRCHVTGPDAPGGVCRVDKVAGREDVGCESCHGAGSLHVGDPTTANIVGKPGVSSCVGCHNLENSPHFDFALYLPKVLGPGHGAPKP